MSITNGYATLNQLKNRLKITADDDDTLLEEAIESASREIDKHCMRRFYADTVATARTYYVDKPCLAKIDDFYTTSGLIVKTDSGDDGSYASTLTIDADYILQPLNGVVDGESGWPFWEIKTFTPGVLPTWTQRPGIQVTAKWGWAAVPSPVYQSCLIMATANYKLKDSAFGSVGISEIGIVTVKQTPAAMVKLAPYCRNSMLVA